MPKVDSLFHTFRDAVLCNLDVATAMLAEDPKLVLLRNNIGETVMHFLAIENHQDAVAWLIEHGAEVDTENEFGQTPLMEVGSLGLLDMCLILIAYGAEFLRINSRGDSVFSAAAETDQAEALGYFLALLAPEEDVNPFFDNIAAEMVLKHSPKCAALLNRRGLTKRWN